jgi:hypothetical protein
MNYFAKKANNNKSYYLMIALMSTSIMASSIGSVPVFAACTNWAGLPDNDCDALADAWEASGYDVNSDGIIDLNLPALGANPNHKDIFLEIDYMQYHAPRPGVVEAVVAAFAGAPVSNPDSNNGISLHPIVNEQIPHQTSIQLWTAFDSLKDTYFGTSSERSKPANIVAKDNIYHYVLFVHQYNGLSSSGISELPGDDIIISLGAPGWGTYYGHTVGSVDQQQGTLMHELGHNLGLRHGGNVDENCKPNYLSVMSYSRQFSDYVGNRPLDYSRSSLGQLNEASLSETNGVSPASVPVGMSTVYGPNSALVSQPLSAPTNPINWDRDTNPSETGISANINNLGSRSGCTSTGNTVLSSYDDWSNLKYWGISGGWGDGASRVPSDVRIPIPEKDIANLFSSRASIVTSIVTQINSLTPQDVKDPTVKSVLGNALHQILTKLNSNDIQTGLNGLASIRKNMDSSSNGDPADDLIINPGKQKMLLFQIDNLGNALQKQR